MQLRLGYYSERPAVWRGKAATVQISVNSKADVEERHGMQCSILRRACDQDICICTYTSRTECRGR